MRNVGGASSPSPSSGKGGVGSFPQARPHIIPARPRFARPPSPKTGREIALSIARSSRWISANREFFQAKLRVSSGERKTTGRSAMKLVQQRNLLCGVALAAGVVGLCAGVSMLQSAATAEDAMVEAPIFEVDPLWPKPLPGEGLLGMTIGV